MRSDRRRGDRGDGFTSIAVATDVRRNNVYMSDVGGEHDERGEPGNRGK
jgi:hypothetical protein